MIGIVSLNMSLDKIYLVDSFLKGEVTRVKETIDMAGGKGTHVANICSELSIPAKLIGFIAGHTGEKVQTLLRNNNIDFDFVKTEGDTRTCLNIISADDNTQTEFLESGLYVTDEELEEFLVKYEDLCNEAKVIVISGSGYKNMPKDFYGRLCKIAKGKNRIVIVDASGDNLLEAIKEKPYAIKPNKDEVKVLSSSDEPKKIIKDLLKKGIKMPILSRGAKGAIIGYEDKIYKIENPQVEAINCVGSGDAFIGGLAVGLYLNTSPEEIFSLACACGTANTLQLESGKIDKKDVDRLLKEIKISTL